VNTLAATGTWSLIPTILATIVGFPVAAIVAAYVVHRIVPDATLRVDNDLKAAVLSIIGVLYAVLLGFVAIGVWDRFEQAELRTYEEGTYLQEVYRDAGSFPQGSLVRAQIRRYTKAVISYDWMRMNDGLQAPVTRIRIESIDALVRHLRVRDPEQQDVHEMMLEALRGALWARDSRITMLADGLNPAVTWVLLAGAFYTIVFSCLIGFRDPRERPVTIGGLGAMIGLVLFLTLSLDYPFRGAIHVEAGAFTHALGNYDLIDRANHILR
jgi:Protein of unknown function (DUF4239)